jgi:hypothetical protein
MAIGEIAAKRVSAASSSPRSFMAGAGVMALGWLVPGAGYWVSRKWIRGGLVLVSVVAMFAIGLALHGETYTFNTGAILDILGFVGELCAGALYFILRIAGGTVANYFSVGGDYGTKFLIAAGLLNLLAASDARDIYLGRKR